MITNKKVCAVIAAAGSGTRMGGVSKPNIELLGKTLFEYVLSAFDQSVADEIVVVCSADNKKSLESLSQGFNKPVTFVLGGETRADSVFNGVNASNQGEIFCVHDCARPFITAEIIDKLISHAAEKGASCICTPVTDTVKIRDASGKVLTPDRSNMFAVQTPQCFEKSIYLKCREKTATLCQTFTDETSLLEFCGFEVSYVEYDKPNLKLTCKGDVALAEAIMKFQN